MHKCGTTSGDNIQPHALANGGEPRSSDEEKGGERRLGRARRISSMIVPRGGRSSSTDNPTERRSSSVSKTKRRSRSFPRPLSKCFLLRVSWRVLQHQLTRDLSAPSRSRPLEKYRPINCPNQVRESQFSDSSMTSSNNSLTNGNGLASSDGTSEETGTLLPGRARRTSSLSRPRPSSITKPKQERRRSSSVGKPKRRSKAFSRFSRKHIFASPRVFIIPQQRQLTRIISAVSPPRPKPRRSIVDYSGHGYSGRQSRRFDQTHSSDTSSDDSAVRNGDTNLIDRRLHRSSSQSLDVVDLSNDWVYDHCVGHPSNIVMADEDLEDFVTRMAGSKLTGEEPQGVDLCIFRRISDGNGKFGIPSTTLPFLSNEAHCTMKDMIKRLQEGSSGRRFLTFTKAEAKAITSGAEHIIFCLPQVRMRPQFDKDAFGAMRVSDVLAMTSERPLVVEVILEEISKRGEQLNIY